MNKGGDELARKKDKIKVDLELPKSDSTMLKLYGILGVCMILGISSIVFWFINSPFLPTPNGQPMFVNLACGRDPTFYPDMGDNESCSLMHDEAQTSTYVAPKAWPKFYSKGQRFIAPGLMQEDRGNFTGELLQPFTWDCVAKADEAIPYTLQLWDSEDRTLAESNGFANEGKCQLKYEHVEPGEQYSIVAYSDDSGLMKLRPMEFTISIETYDGIPEYMNNASLWVGPEVDLGITSFRPTLFLNFFGIGIFVAFFPASYYWDGVKNRVNAKEEKFPDFLRDLAEYWKGGLSMNVAVQTLANSEYGPLNPEVKKMANQLSWGVAFGDVILLFADSVGTPLVKRAISLIAEANKAGGKISDILVTAANDSREIKFLEGERKRAISSYIAVIWVSYMVFLGVIVVLGKVFIPAIASSNSEGDGEGDDAAEGDDEEGESGGAELGNMTIRAIDPLFFLMVFYYGVTLQAVGNGVMAGLMATGRFSSGMKHAGMMIVLALFAFNFVVFSPDLIGIQQAPGIDVRAGTFDPPSRTANTMPEAIGLAIEPISPSDSSNLSATYTFSDADGHGEASSKIKWFKNGELQIIYSDQKAIPSSATSVGDEWSFTVTPHDGLAYGNTVGMLEPVTVVA